jgi:arginase
MIKLIPYPFGAGATRPGPEHGPIYLKTHGLGAALAAQGVRVVWQDDPEDLFRSGKFGLEFHKNLPPRGSPERREAVLYACARMRDRVAEVLKAGDFPVTLGGDHSLAMGSVAGLAEARQAHGRIGMVWIDAHGDINTPETTPSQSYHGMGLAALLGYGDPEFCALGGGQAVLRPEHVAYIGVRDLDPREVALIRDLNIRVFGMDEVRAKGMAAVFREAREIVSCGTDYTALSIDLDAFDPEDAPAVGSPVPGGLRAEEFLSALPGVFSPDLIDIVEFNPSMGDGEKTSRLVAALLINLSGG